MSDRLFGLSHAYPDFPLQQRPSKSPKSPSGTSPGNYEVPRSTRDRLPTPLRGLNQVRFRQFKKQIEGIRKGNYDLQKKEVMVKSSSNLAEKIRTIREETQDKDCTLPRNDLHRQVISMIKVLEGVKGSLNTNFQVVAGEFGDIRKSPETVCPLCKCGCRVGGKMAMGVTLISDPNVTEIRMDQKSFIVECLQCSSRYLHEFNTPDYLCPSCKSGNSPSTPGNLSLLLELHIEEQIIPPRSRTPTPPPLDRTIRSPGASRSPPAETDRSPRKRLVISPARRISSIYRRSDDIPPSSSKLSLSICGTSIRLTPGSHLLKVTLPERFEAGERRGEGKEAPVPPATPSFHSGHMEFGGIGDRKNEEKTEIRTDVMDISFSQNFLTDSPSIDFDLPLLDLSKSLHSEIEYVLSDHLQVASRHQYVFEVSDICESYAIMYLNLLRRVWKLLMPYLPEAVSSLEMCVKGLILVLETTLSTFSAQKPEQKRHSDVSEKLQRVLMDLNEERKKTDKLEKSLKNVIRNYEEMISMYSREQMETIGITEKTIEE